MTGWQYIALLLAGAGGSVHAQTPVCDPATVAAQHLTRLVANNIPWSVQHQTAFAGYHYLDLTAGQDWTVVVDAGCRVWNARPTHLAAPLPVAGVGLASAHTGAQRLPLRLHPRPTVALPLTDGLGHAYPTDPLSSPLSPVTLPRLYDDGHRLDGMYAWVRSLRIDPDSLAVPSSDGANGYFYPPNLDSNASCDYDVADCSNFDAVNVYYHIDRFAQTFWRDRMGIDLPYAVEVGVHAVGGGAIAYPSQHYVVFRAGDVVSRNAALEDEVIYHEYTHYVTYLLGLPVDTTSTEETRALGEAYSDYFAATFTDDPRIGEWFVECPSREDCEGPPDDDDLTTLATDPTAWNWNFGSPSTDLRYSVCTRKSPADLKCKTIYRVFVPAYVWAMIFSSTLWDVRTALGADVTDRLVVAGLLNVHGRDTRLADALTGLLLADEQLYGGHHQDTLRTLFYRRGFIPASVAAETSPAVHLSLHPGYPNPFATTTTLMFDLPAGMPVLLVVHDATGREVARLADGWYPPGRHRVRLAATGWPAGVYLATLTTAAGRRTVQLIHVP
jgi:hypothetical protein